MTWLAEMYVTLLPGMLAGILNMAWCTLPVARWLAKPIDAGRTLKDGQRLFGDHKTWKGLIGMTLLGALTTVLWGWLCDLIPAMGRHNLFYEHLANQVWTNIGLGLAIGLAYALCELPNSFWKRRRGIRPGQRTGRLEGLAFAGLDQVDSIIGMVLVVACFHPMTLGYFLAYVAVGGLTHVVVNLLLFAAHLRKAPL
ncbi:MAG: CDP-archaeol synthase [Propionibacteriaceae bacterium]|jgi:CDP-diglyceride synthetase|nr:CDP-archaeol synthase [Propionibacteriaceae bacterium]